MHSQLSAGLGSAQVVTHDLNGFAQLLYQAAVGIPVILPRQGVGPVQSCYEWAAMVCCCLVSV